jgi:hypothetical protein
LALNKGFEMTDQEIEALLKDFGFPIFENHLEAGKHRILEIFDKTYSTSAVTDELTPQEMIDAAHTLGFEVIETLFCGKVNTVKILRPVDGRYASFHHFTDES